MIAILQAQTTAACGDGIGHPGEPVSNPKHRQTRNVVEGVSQVRLEPDERHHVSRGQWWLADVLREQ